LERILITGSGGYIGGSLKKALKNSGLETIGLRRAGAADEISADLLDPESLRKALSGENLTWVIHAVGRSKKDSYSQDIKKAVNLLEALRNLDRRPGLIFLSSVSVYGEDGRSVVSIDDEKRPSGEYGRSKVQCEELFVGSGFDRVYILRLTPVFDGSNRRNLRVRAYLPGTGIKIRILPSFPATLCSMETLTSKIVDMIRRKEKGVFISNAGDDSPYDQNEIAASFPGFSFPLPEILFRPFYYVLKIIPGRTSYSLRCFYWKLFRGVVYR